MTATARGLLTPAAAGISPPVGRRFEVSAARLETEATKDPSPGRALALLLAGETEAGLALYETCLRAKDRNQILIGIHLLVLERAGRESVAEELRRLTLRRGGNVAARDRAGGSPEEAAEEYAHLFERGIANADMIFRYLILLSRLGRSDEVAALLDPGRLLRTVRLDRPAPGGETAGLAAATLALLLREEARAVDRDAVQPLSGVRMLERFHELEDPVALALLAQLRDEADRYLRDWAASDHPLAHLVPREFELKAWGLFARDGGFSTRHTHSAGWATGIYYPAGLPGDVGGELVIGPPDEIEEQSPGWPRAVIRPEPGLLVLLPSYCMHWTAPLAGPGLRTSIAFDLHDLGLRQSAAPAGGRP